MIRIRFILALVAVGLLCGLQLPLPAEIALSGSKGMRVAVEGIKQAEKGALVVQPKAGEALQRVPWQLFDMAKLRVEHPSIYAGFLKAQSGDPVVLDLGTCEGTVAPRAFKFDSETGFEEVTDVEWLDNNYMDGDSFHVMANGDRLILRLYHVDTPESDTNFPDRLADQQDYFGANRTQLLELAHHATAQTRQLLKKGKFTIYTKWVDARGNSSLPRHYAYVVFSDGTLLSEHLIAKGLARIYGMTDVAPDGSSQEKWIAHLKKLEREAKRAAIGGWAKGE